ncbi:MAG: hypothetical protein ABIR91_05345 [Candidatus Saccharimonadales bacterium]
MSFDSGCGGGISTASDVAFNTLVNTDVMAYDSGSSKWRNNDLTGKVALANKGGSETVSTANATGATTLNLANGNVFNMTLTGNATLSFSGATVGRACAFSLYLRQDATGGRTTTWPASVKWSGGAPTLTTTANAVNILVFESIDGGTTWFGSLVGADFK